MCAVALANYIWNSSENPTVERCNMDIWYTDREGLYKLNKYELWNINHSNDDREMEVQIIRGGGGINCKISLRRESRQEGSKVEMTHSEQHVAGLREEYYLWKQKVQSGRHYNSRAYGQFEGFNNHPDRKKLVLYCEVKTSSGNFVTNKYELEITSIVLKKP
jgi:hypothetical protein